MRSLYDDERAAALEWAEVLFRAHPLSHQQIQTAGDALLQYYDMHEPISGMVDLLGELQARGLRQAVVSNWPPSLPSFLEFHGVHFYFESVVFSAQDGIGKPDPRIFHRALRGMNLQPHEAIFVGDSQEADVAGAAAVGMRSIHFDSRRRDVPALRRLILNSFGV